MKTSRPHYRCFYCDLAFAHDPNNVCDRCSNCGREALLFVPPTRGAAPSKKLLSSVSAIAHKKLQQAVIELPQINFTRRDLPKWAVETMYGDYLQLRSLIKTGKLYGISRHAIYDIFKKYQYPLCARKFHMVIVYQGHTFSQDKNGYYNAKGTLLHHVLWENHTGRKVPDGWQVTFKNNNNVDFSPANLHCAPMGEIVVMHYRRRFKDRLEMTPEQIKEYWRAYHREYYQRRKHEAA